MSRILFNWLVKNIKVGTQNQGNREAWLEKTLKSIPAGCRILDAGAGQQQYKKWCSHLVYVAQDFAQYNGRGDTCGLQTDSWNQTKLNIISDIVSIPESDSSFDAIMCIEVMEHLPEPISVIREFSRLLKTGGQLILTAPFCSLTHFSPYHFYTGFNRYFYETHLAQYGIDIIEIQANGNFFEYIAQEILRLPYVVRRYSESKFYKWQYLIIIPMLLMLKRYAIRDTGSSELLNHGYHILAIKKRNLNKEKNS